MAGIAVGTTAPTGDRRSEEEPQPCQPAAGVALVVSAMTTSGSWM